MKVFLDLETDMASRGMRRVATAFTRYAPDSIKVVKRNESPDLHIVHLFAADIPPNVCAPAYVLVQYCGQQDWSGLWNGAKLVWSYYDLAAPRFLRSPLGVDPDVFRYVDAPRDVGVVTSGYVNGSAAEAIEDVADAAQLADVSVFHLGPQAPAGMNRRSERSWRSQLGIYDSALASWYARSQWVSGLRYVEGFELPVIEGFACGARPVVFDRPEMRHWYEDFAEFVPEVSGAPLVAVLENLFSQGPRPVTRAERDAIISQFSWKEIAENFWKRVLES